MRRIDIIRAEANDNQRELKNKNIELPLFRLRRSIYFRGRVTHGNTNDGRRLDDSWRESAIMLAVEKYSLLLTMSRETFEAVQLGRVSRDKENKGDRVNRA